MIINRYILLSICLHITLLVLLTITWTPSSERLSANRPIIYATLAPLPQTISVKKAPIKKVLIKKKSIKKIVKETVQKHVLTNNAMHKMIAEKKIKDQLAAKKLVAKQHWLAKQEAIKQHAAKLKRLQEKKQLEQQLTEKMAQERAEEKLQEQIAEEHRQWVAARNARMNREIDKYKVQLVVAISHHWLIPKGIDRSLSCKLLISVAPGGAVLDVKLLQSSGNVGLDRSVLAAVRKASPLPVPTEAELFDKFRELRLTVRPEDVI